jgi:hypothetical protein
MITVIGLGGSAGRYGSTYVNCSISTCMQTFYQAEKTYKKAIDYFYRSQFRLTFRLFSLALVLIHNSFIIYV